MRTKIPFHLCSVLAGLLLLPVPSVRGQAQPTDTTASAGSVKGTLAGSQAGYQNWSEGGLNALSFTASINGQFARIDSRWEQKYDFRLAYGLLKQDTLDVRKSDDLINAKAALQYRGDGFFRFFKPTLSASIRTQFMEGFNYTRDPFNSGRTPPVKVSDFFAPASASQSLGLTYQPVQWFTQRVGFSAKQTIVTIDRFRPLYGNELDQVVRDEYGLEAFTEVDREIFTNVRYQSTLGLFAAFNQANQPDLLWENLISMKVNSWLTVNFEFVTLYDHDYSTKFQFKEVLSVAVSYTLI